MVDEQATQDENVQVDDSATADDAEYVQVGGYRAPVSRPDLRRYGDVVYAQGYRVPQE